MSYSDTYKVAKCCLYEKKSMLTKKKGGDILKKNGRGQHRILSTRTCGIDYIDWKMTTFYETNKSKFNHTIDIVIVAFECMLYNKHSDLSVVK